MTDKPQYENIEDERAIRLQKLSILEEQGIAPYQVISKRTHSIVDALALPVDSKVAIAGRMVSKRVVGKIIFAVIQDGSAAIQIIIKSDEIGAEAFKLFLKMADIGDFIEAIGTRFLTQREEESVLVREWKLLSKAVRPLPDKFHGLKDKETRYRKRYLDLITDREVFERFKVRSKIPLIVIFLDTVIERSITRASSSPPFRVTVTTSFPSIVGPPPNSRLPGLQAL
jgi:lysyl-tRNA synthetase class 2